MTRPSWPSLYNPSGEIPLAPGSDEIPVGAVYLDNAHDVFTFTLIWTLVLYTPIFVACGLYAFLNLSFPPSRNVGSVSEEDNATISYPLSPLSPMSPSTHRTSLVRQQQHRPLKPPKLNERRSRLTFAILVWFAFIVLSVTAAVIGSAVLGYVLVGLYTAARYNISTWVPFLWVVIQIFIGLMSVQSSIIDIL